MKINRNIYPVINTKHWYWHLSSKMLT